MAQARYFEVELKGKYAWELLVDFHYDRSATIGKDIEIDRTVTYSFSDLQKSVISSNSDISVDFNWAALVDVFDVRVTGDTELNLQPEYRHLTAENYELEDKKFVTPDTLLNLQSEYLYLTENKLELVDHKKVTKTFFMAGHTSLKLYRLMFFGPGLNFLTDIVSRNYQTPNALNDASVWIRVRQKLLLENLEVVYTDNVLSRPQRSLSEVSGLNPDINADYGGKHVWLVPTWTDNPEKALTGIEFVMQDYENPSLPDLAMGTGGAHRYLIMKRDPSSKQRITEVALYRTNKENEYPECYGWGWDHRTKDLNLDRHGDYLYLCWKSLQL